MTDTNVPYSAPRVVYEGSGSYTNDRSSYSSAAAPRDYSPQTVLKRDMKNAINSFGGKLYLSKNHMNMPIIVHAVKLSSQEQINKRSEWYRWAGRHGNLRFLSYERSYPLGEYTAYTFGLNEDCRSMRYMMEHDQQRQYCERLFEMLVEFLYDYKQAARAEYRPLCCLSLDTVFMDENGSIYILPLISNGGRFPRGYPMEASQEDDVDETTDLYTAALLTKQVLSGCEYESKKRNQRLKKLNKPECLERCMDVGYSNRPLLQEVYSSIRREQSGTGAAEGKSRPAVDYNGNPIPVSGKEPARDKGRRKVIRGLWSGICDAFEPSEDRARTEGHPPAGTRWSGMMSFQNDIDDDVETEPADKKPDIRAMNRPNDEMSRESDWRPVPRWGASDDLHDV